MSAAGSPRKQSAPPAADAAAAAPVDAPTSTGKPQRVYAELTEADIPDVIERLPKPDKAAHDAAISKIDAEIKKLQARSNVIRTELDALKGGRGKFGEPIKAAKAVFSSLRAEKDALIQQRNQLTQQVKSAQDTKESTLKTQRSLRSALKFSSEEEFDREIASLRHQQETRSMSLTEEKRLIKEIEALQQQKLQVSKFTDEKSAVDKHSESIKDLRALQTAKNLEIDAVSAKLNAQKLVLDDLYAQNEAENKADKFPVLANERTAIKKQLDGLFTNLKELRASFRDENNKYYQNIRMVRFKKDLERKQEEEQRKAAYAAKLADYEAEMAKIHPFQDEMDLADALIVYLENVFAKELKADAADKRDAAAAVVVELDGLKPLTRKEEDFMSFGGKGGKKSKKTGPSKKAPASKKEAKVALSLAQLDAFSSIGLVPPSTLSALSESLQAIKDKKAWFAAQTTRPSTKKSESDVKTDDNKAATDAATSPKKNGSSSNGKKAGNKKFNASDKHAFPSLGGAAANDSDASPAAAPFAAWGPGIGPSTSVPTDADFPAANDDFGAVAADENVIEEKHDTFPSAEDFPAM